MEGLLSQPLIVVFDSIDSSFPPANTIVDYLITKYNVEKYSTTVIRSEKKWSTIKGPNGHFAVEPKNMQGIENQCIIFLANIIELDTISQLDVVTRARNGLIIVINCDNEIKKGYRLKTLWKKTIEGIMNQSTDSNADDRIARIVLAKKTPDENGVHLDENLDEIRKFLRSKGFNKIDSDSNEKKHGNST